MALAPIGMANPNVGIFEANNPIVDTTYDLEDTLLPNFANGMLEFKIIPPYGPVGGEQLPRWSVYINVFVGSSNPVGTPSNLVWGFAESTDAPDVTVVPVPNLVPGQDHAGTLEWGYAGFVWGVGVGESYELNPNPFVTGGNPARGFSLFLAISRDEGDTTDYPLRIVQVSRRDVS